MRRETFDLNWRILFLHEKRTYRVLGIRLGVAQTWYAVHQNSTDIAFASKPVLLVATRKLQRSDICLTFCSCRDNVASFCNSNFWPMKVELWIPACNSTKRCKHERPTQGMSILHYFVAASLCMQLWWKTGSLMIETFCGIHAGFQSLTLVKNATKCVSNPQICLLNRNFWFWKRLRAGLMHWCVMCITHLMFLRSRLRRSFRTTMGSFACFVDVVKNFALVPDIEFLEALLSESEHLSFHPTLAWMVKNNMRQGNSSSGEVNSALELRISTLESD